MADTGLFQGVSATYRLGKVCTIVFRLGTAELRTVVKILALTVTNSSQLAFKLLY
jgi:hypothetical protein